jgi:hypothetical protein
MKMNAADSDYDSDDPPALTPFSKRKKRPLAITNGLTNNSDDSMPDLQSVSNSSDESESISESDEDDDGDEDEDSDDSGYDTEQEDEMRDWLREAMDTAHEADWLDTTNAPAEIDPFQDDRKGNPFLRLLGSLRGKLLRTLHTDISMYHKINRSYVFFEPET